MNTRNAAGSAVVVALGMIVAGAGVNYAAAGNTAGSSIRNPSRVIPSPSPGLSGTPAGITEVGKYTMAVGGTLYGNPVWGLPSTTYKVGANGGSPEMFRGGSRADAYFAEARDGAATADPSAQNGILSPKSTGNTAFLKIKVDGNTRTVGFASAEERAQYVANLKNHAGEMGLIVKSKAP